MFLLKFFLDWGKHGLGALWLPYIGLSILFIYRSAIAYKSGWYKVDPVKGITSGKEKLKWYQYHQFAIYWVAITIAAIVIHLLIQSDYR